MTTSIEKIREQVAMVRKEHPEMTHFGQPGTGFCGGEHDHPCPIVKLAEKVLKLAEAMERAKSVLKDGDWVRGHLILEAAMAAMAAMAEVAE